LPAHTIYFGGGTPSLLSSSQFSYILEVINESFEILPNVEITLEANPNSFHHNPQLLNIEINRISIGAQSSHQPELFILGRKHTFNDVKQLVSLIRSKGRQQINIDLIYGIPHQDLISWKKTLDDTTSLNPEHISLYSLTVEKGTILEKQLASGELAPIDEDLAADMYEYSRQYLNKLGFIHYEISNWARTNQNGQPYVCNHNLQYWLNLPYIGFGAGAHSFMSHKRFRNTNSIVQYIKNCTNEKNGSFPTSLATQEVIELSQEDEMNETIFMGLRLVQRGILCEEFFMRFGIPLEQQYGKKIEKLIALNLLEWYNINNQRGLRLTSKGCLLANQVFIHFI
jgi:oxygen-independent coproporphyrinogen-3 oxidase